MSEDSFWKDAARERHRQFGKPDTLCDQQAALETAAQNLFFPALASFQGAVRKAATLSSLKRRDFHYLLDALDDHTPSRTRWDEQLTEQSLGEQP